MDRLLVCETDPTEDSQIYKNKIMEIVNELTNLHFGQDQTDDSKVIHCMAHSPQIWFRESLVKNGSPRKPDYKKKIMRTSDDFFPDLNDSNGHRWHITSNAFTSMVAQGRGFIPDFDDMTMSDHQWAGYHGCLRAFSSAPIYLTDRRGQHDLSIFKQLTAPLKADPSRRGVVQPIDGRAGAVLSSCALGQAALDLSSAATPWGLLKIGLSAPYAGGALIGIWNVKQRNASQNDDNLMAVDVLTARDIAETMLSTSESCCSGSSKKNKEDDTQERKTGSTQDLVLVNLHRPSNDPSSHSIIRRLELLNDFDLEAEFFIPQRSSRPVVETVLDYRPENGYQVWRVLSLVNLPDSASNNFQVQVASLGLLDQFAGLCAVTTVTSNNTPPTRSLAKSEPRHNPPPRASPMEMENGEGDDGKGLIDYISTILLRPAKNAFSKDRVKALIYQIARHPLRSLVAELGCLGKLVWSSILYLFLSPLSSNSSAPAPLIRDPEPSNQPLLTERISSPSPSSNNTKSLRFICPFNGPIGFIIRLNHFPSNNHLSENQIDYQDLRSVIRIKIDNQIIQLPSQTQQDGQHPHTKKGSGNGGVIHIQTLHFPSQTINPSNDACLFLVLIDLNQLINLDSGISSNHTSLPKSSSSSSSWTIDFERFGSL